MNEQPDTTDSWPTARIIKYVLLPKPKGSPRAGIKEKVIRGGVATFFLVVLLIWWAS